MPTVVRCPKCEGTAQIALNPNGYTRMKLDGTLECHGCVGVRWPISMDNDVVIATAKSLPISESNKLAAVPSGISEDVREAERCHFNGSYKASTVMCRRALQLALEDKLGLVESVHTLGRLLKDARNQSPPLLNGDFDAYAKRVLDIGNVGAHKTVDLNPKTVEVVIHDTVAILNELYKPLATQPGSGTS